MATTQEQPAGGGGGTGSGDWISVRGLTVAIGAAAIAALLLLCTYITHPLPTFVAKALSVHEGDFAERGGLRMEWAPPSAIGDDELVRIARSLGERSPDAYVWVERERGALGVALAGVPADQIDATVDRLTKSEGLAFREVVRVDAMKQLASFVPSDRFDADQWRSEDDGTLHEDYYVTAPTREELDAMFAEARGKGWTLPAGLRIAYEHREPLPGSPKPAMYRSYVVRDEAALDGMSVENAVKSYDPNTNRPIVLVDFNRAGARTFGDLTGRIAGEKLAIMVGGEIKSAPVITSAIRGGRASIMMGGNDAQKAESDADALVATLKLGWLPKGGRVLSAAYVAPTGASWKLWLARLLVALGGALIAAGIAVAVVRFAKPERRRVVTAAGSAPWSRVAALLVAPVAIWVVSAVPIYGLDELRFPEFVSRGHHALTIGALGLMPLITAYIVIEVFALILPTWRRRRHAGPIARQPITLAAAVLTILLVAFQGWNMAQYLGAIEGALEPGLVPKLLVVASLLGGTLILIVAAELIRWRGLGNGYGALLVASAFDGAITHWKDPGMASWHDRAVPLAAIVAIVTIFAVALRWRVRRPGELALRSPSSSIAPLADAGGALALLVFVSQLQLGDRLFRVLDWVGYLRDHALSSVGVVALLAIGWSLVFARPPAFAGAARPSWDAWGRATVVSIVALVGVALVKALEGHVAFDAGPITMSKPNFVEPVMLGLIVAVVLDVIDDFRARRGTLVVAWTLHQPHHADAVIDMLAADGIAAHASASNLRTLLAFFGPFAPIEILVPVEHGAAAREKLEALVY